MTGETGKSISRKDFLKSTGFVAGGLAVLGSGALAGGCTAEEASVQKTLAEAWLPSVWDQEADVVVVGMGAAGIACAIESKKAGADVLILEKAPEDEAGGASGVNGGWITIASFAGANMTTKTYRDSVLNTVSEEYAKAYIDVAKTIHEWLEEMGVPLTTNGGITTVTGEQFGNTGYVLYECLKAAVNDAGIKVMYSTPAIELIQNPVTKDVVGVKAGSNDSPIYVKARKGVALMSGGYEHNPQMVSDYHFPLAFIACSSSPYNTGDGFKMAAAAGVKIHNLQGTLEWFNMAFRVPSEELNTGIMFQNSDFQSYIYVDKQGQRFVAEDRGLVHEKTTEPILEFFAPFAAPGDVVGYPHLPAFVVFDDKTMKQGPLGMKFGPGSCSWNTAHPTLHRLHEWSDDNQTELGKGWIVQADTVEELASKLKATDMWGKTIGVDAKGLADTVAAYNASCAAGVDSAFSRSIKTMSPLDTPPYYAAEVCMDQVYTIGGPAHDEKAQAIDFNDQPIPRLYLGGNVGDNGLHGTHAVPGAITWGRIAAQNVVNQEVWT